MPKQIHQYIYNKKKQPIGVLAAVAEQGAKTVHIGWSLCAANKGDKFDKERGLNIAVSRSVSGSVVNVPDSISIEFTKFGERVEKYFKGKTITN